MGQGKVDKPKGGMDTLKALAALKDDWTLTEVPSFEVWAAATCYDPSKADGGAAFQAMMFWALTAGKPISWNAKSVNIKIGETHYVAPDKRRQWTDDRLPKHAQDFGDDRYEYLQGKVNYASKTQSKSTNLNGSSAQSMTSHIRGFMSGGWKTGKGETKAPNALETLMTNTGSNAHGSIQWC